jgi:DNA-binding NtrC family response regulator
MSGSLRRPVATWKKWSATGEFRADLYYRLNVITLKTPPLRARVEDLPMLAEYLLEHICRQQGVPLRGISAAAIERLACHDWPGNVRELANVLERALLVSDNDCLEAADLDGVMPAPSVVAASNRVEIAEVVAQAERDAIAAALRATRGNKAQAAKVLGISRAASVRKDCRAGGQRDGGVNCLPGQTGCRQLDD